MRHQLATWRDTTTLFEHALRTTRDNFIAHDKLGRAYLRAGDYDAAIEQLSAALRIEPRWPEPRASLGEALLHKGRVDEAIWNCREAVRLDPESVGLRVHLAHVLLGAGWVDDAILELGEALRRDDGRRAARIHGLLGLSYGRRGDAARAMAHLRQAIALDPSVATPRANLGALLLQQGDAAGAEHELRAAVAAADGQPELHTALGDALQRLDRDAEAIAEYRAALRVDPRHRDAANELAWLLATAADAALRAPDEALQWAELAVAATQRSDASALDTLAVSLAAAGRFAEAIATLDEALALAPGEPTDSRASEQRAQMQERRALFTAGRPYVEAPRP
jgi:Flp pilus assembly protein TadD